MITVKLFAVLKDKAGRDEILIDTGTGNVSELLEAISRGYPALSRMISDGGILISVNREFARGDAMVKDGDEVALMPPFSGGAQQGINPKSQKKQITNKSPLTPLSQRGE